jgi:hypothetical protein
MATSEASANLELIKWRNDYWTEYVRTSGYAPYMGAGPNSIFYTMRDLIDGGKDLIVPLVGSLKGKGVGAGLLTGAEDKFDTYDFRTRPWWRRNAVTVKKSAQAKSAIDLFKARGDVLKLWSSDDMRESIMDALSYVSYDDTHYDEDAGIGRGVTLAETDATHKNAWVLDNPNRILFGISTANLVSGNYASSIANVDTTADTWSAGIIDAARGLARARNRQTGQRGVRPYRSTQTDGREYFVLFVETRAFNKLRADADIKAANKDARAREGGGMNDNPIFQGGDLIWNGVIIHEIPEQTSVLLAAGAASADVSVGYLCGAQALAIGWGQDPIPTQRKDDDYGFIKGVGTEELRSVEKTFFQTPTSVGPGEQFGVVTVFGAV